MGNRWRDCKGTLSRCAEYKSILYLLDKGFDGYPMLDKIEVEFNEKRASQTFNDWLEHSAKHLKILVMDAKHDYYQHSRERTASTPILIWADVLASYLKFKHDTPSCLQLWRWAASGHREQRKTEDELAHLNIRLEGDILSFGSVYHTSYNAYRKLFRDHINTQSIFPDSKMRKHEKLRMAFERRGGRSIQNEK